MWVWYQCDCGHGWQDYYVPAIYPGCKVCEECGHDAYAEVDPPDEPEDLDLRA